MYVLRRRYRQPIDAVVLMIGVAMLLFNLACSLCHLGDRDSVGADVRYAVIQFSWLALSSWIMIFVLLLEDMQPRARSWRLFQFVLRHRQLVGWGVPLLLTGVIFSMYKTPITSKGSGCWFHGISSSHVGMWLPNLLVCLLIIVTLFMASFRAQRRFSKGKAVGGVADGHDDSDDPLLSSESTSLLVDGGNGAGGAGGGTAGNGSLNRDPNSATVGAGGGEGGGGGGGGGILPSWNRQASSSSSSQFSSGNATPTTKRESRSRAWQGATAQDNAAALAVALASASSAAAADADGMPFDNFLDENARAVALANAARLHPGEFRHMVFIVFELLTMLLAFIDPTMSYIKSDVVNGTSTLSGPAIELNFLNVVISSAQGVFLFCCFGLDEALWLPLTTRCGQLADWVRKMVYQTESDDLARMREWHTLHGDLTQINAHCTAIRDMKAECEAAIAKTKRYHLRTYRDVFTGTQLIDYLMERGLAEDRYHGLDYGRDLLMGDLIVHVSHEHHFHDCGYFYRFCTKADAKRKTSFAERRDRASSSPVRPSKSSSTGSAAPPSLARSSVRV
jgi:hypothetical protein